MGPKAVVVVGEPGPRGSEVRPGGMALSAGGLPERGRAGQGGAGESGEGREGRQRRGEKQGKSGEAGEERAGSVVRPERGLSQCKDRNARRRSGRTKTRNNEELGRAKSGTPGIRRLRWLVSVFRDRGVRHRADAAAAAQAPRHPATRTPALRSDAGGRIESPG